MCGSLDQVHQRGLLRNIGVGQLVERATDSFLFYFPKFSQSV